MGCNKQNPFESLAELIKVGAVTVGQTEGLEKSDRVVLGRPRAPLAQTRTRLLLAAATAYGSEATGKGTQCAVGLTGLSPALLEPPSDREHSGPGGVTALSPRWEGHPLTCLCS